MQPVEISFINNSVILRARNSELFILPQHVEELQKLQETRKFSTYFIQEALCNRTARKLFEAWLRKDSTVWPRLFKLVHENKSSENDTKEKAPAKVAKPAAAVEAKARASVHDKAKTSKTKEAEKEKEPAEKKPAAKAKKVTKAVVTKKKSSNKAASKKTTTAKSSEASSSKKKVTKKKKKSS